MLKHVILGSVSITAIQATTALPIDEMAKLIIQVVVGIVTIIKLLKKPKKEN